MVASEGMTHWVTHPHDSLADRAFPGSFSLASDVTINKGFTVQDTCMSGSHSMLKFKSRMHTGIRSKFWVLILRRPSLKMSLEYLNLYQQGQDSVGTCLTSSYTQYCPTIHSRSGQFSRDMCVSQ